MKTGADLLAKSAKAAAPKAPRVKGPVPPQLAKNKEWTAFVLEHAAENGWDAFEAKNGDEIVEMEASKETEEGPRFDDGSKFTMKHAMSLSSYLKNNDAELWTTFSATWDEEHPKEEKPEAAVTPTRRTRAEISKAAEERREKLAAERKEKARIRAEEKVARDAKKAETDAAKAAAKAAREAKAAAAAAAKVTKSVKAPEATSPAAMARVEALVAKTKAAAPAAESAPAVAAPVKKSLAQAWKVPADGAFKTFPYKGKMYMANNKYHVYTKGAVQGERGDYLGQYNPVDDLIDDSVEEPADEEDEDSFDA